MLKFRLSDQNDSQEMFESIFQLPESLQLFQYLDVQVMRLLDNQDMTISRAAGAYKKLFDLTRLGFQAPLWIRLPKIIDNRVADSAGGQPLLVDDPRLNNRDLVSLDLYPVQQVTA